MDAIDRLSMQPDGGDGLGTLLVLAPHPDDEILGAGAIMARARAAGDAIGIVVLTDGHRSDPGSDAATLVARRRDELVAGLAAMMAGPVPILFLDHPDGALADTPVDLDERGALAAFVRALAPATILVPDAADGHPDHKAAFGLAARLALAGQARRVEAMPISQRVDGVFDGSGYRALPVGDRAAAKARGIAAHASQIAPVDGFALGADVCADFAQVEYLRTAWDRDDDAADGTRPDHFDAMFAGSDDPWNYDGSDYERDRFDRSVALLSDRRYASALELGCANGALAERLLPLCDRVTAMDASAAALAVAGRRLAAAPVTFVRGALPDACPRGPFDLIVASDMLYYLGMPGIAALADRLHAAATPDARILVANWLGRTDTRLSGEMAAETAIACLPGWRRLRAERTDRLRLDLLARR